MYLHLNNNGIGNMQIKTIILMNGTMGSFSNTSSLLYIFHYKKKTGARRYRVDMDIRHLKDFCELWEVFNY